jgi:hypothetical protein
VAAELQAANAGELQKARVMASSPRKTPGCSLRKREEGIVLAIKYYD